MRTRLTDLASRLLERSSRDWISGCLEWTGSLGASGYGQINYQGQSQPVHRLAYKIWVGPIDDDLFACHTCDNRKCFEPAHLWAGTNEDNMQDKYAKSRQHRPRGAINPHSKLTDDIVRTIRGRHENGERYRSISEDYSVTPELIGQICRRKAWKHVV